MKLKNNAPPGLELAYLLNENGGTKIYDSAKNNNAVMTNGPTWDWSSSIHGLKFADTSSQYITCSDKLDTSGGITIVLGCLVSTVGTSPAAFGGYGTDTNADRCQAHIPWTDNVLYWDYGDQTGTGRVSTSYAAYLGKLTNIALVSEGIGGSFKGIYFNGELANSIASSDGPSGNVTIDIGRFIANYHNGIITYFYVFNRRLSAREIMWLDYDSFGMFEPDHTAHYGVAEAAGISIPILMQQMNQFNGGIYATY